MVLTEDEKEAMLIQVAADTNLMKVKLYGQNSFEGDIPEIKQAMCSLRKDHDKLAKVVYWLIGTLVGSGTIAGGVMGWLN